MGCNQEDRAKIINHKPYLSKFPDSAFMKAPNGEFFSTNPGKPDRQEPIRNAFKFIRQWHDIKFVPDVVELANQLKSQNVYFNGEGI
jgi:hypothetical protein